MPNELNEIRQACPGADTSFLVECLEAGWSLEICSRNWAFSQNRVIQDLTTQVTDLTTKLDEAKLEIEKFKEPVIGGSKTDRPALKRFQSGVNQIAATGVPRPQAVSRWIVENQEAHREYLDESLAAGKRKR